MGFKTRITFEAVSGGQERSYGPTSHVVRVMFERMSPYGDSADEWLPDPLYTAPLVCGGDEKCKEVETRVKAMLDRLPVGFTDKTKREVEWFDTYLVYLHQVTAGVWEFKTQHEYTD